MKLDLAGSQRLDDVRQFVQQTICEQNDLDAAAAPMTERILIRRGKSCGVLFYVKGPRSVTLTAIWDQEQNNVLFYDSAGKSRQRMKLGSTNQACLPKRKQSVKEPTDGLHS